MRCDIHLRPADYYADRDIQDDELGEDDLSDWANYDRCVLSSTNWRHDACGKH